MSIFVNDGHVALAELAKNSALHLAWGPGDGSWTAPPSETATPTAVTNEIARRQVTEVQYVVPDSTGPIEIPGVGKFSATSTPTNRLLVTTQFAFEDAPTSVIRQVGLHLGTQLVSGLPAGLRYFAPNQVQSSGRLLQLENLVPVTRSASSRYRHDMLIVF